MKEALDALARELGIYPYTGVSDVLRGRSPFQSPPPPQEQFDLEPFRQGEMFVIPPPPTLPPEVVQQIIEMLLQQQFSGELF